MKTLSLALNVILITALIFCTCKGTGSLSQTQDACIKNTCSDYTGFPADGLVSGSILREMKSLYANDPGKKFVSLEQNSLARSTVEDARAIWFPMDRIKQYIWFIENQICKAGCDKSNLVLKLVYIKYTPDVGTPGAHEDLQGLPAAYANLHSLAMVPGFMVDNKVREFDPRYVMPGCSLRFLDDAGGDTAKVALVLRAGESSPVGGSNHGGLAPPY